LKTPKLPEGKKTNGALLRQVAVESIDSSRALCPPHVLFFYGLVSFHVDVDTSISAGPSRSRASAQQMPFADQLADASTHHSFISASAQTSNSTFSFPYSQLYQNSHRLRRMLILNEG
jgi:hypothetical protein